MNESDLTPEQRRLSKSLEFVDIPQQLRIVFLLRVIGISTFITFAIIAAFASDPVFFLALGALAGLNFLFIAQARRGYCELYAIINLLRDKVE